MAIRDSLVTRGAGSDRGAQRAAAIYSLTVTCKLNGVDPQAYLADALARLPDHPARRIDDLMPWNWKSRTSLRPHRYRIAEPCHLSVGDGPPIDRSLLISLWLGV